MKDNQVTISGVSGRYPKSDNVEHFWSNLFTGVPLYGPDKFPYPKIFSRLPKSRGALNDTRLFDNTFFNYSIKEANTLDPQIRILLEVVHEALWDAGIRPDEWRGTRTGFYLGSAFDDTGLSVRWDYKLDLPQYFAQRVSYFYDWKGPTMIVDTACAASLNALHTAYWSIVNGECDQAVVAGIALHLKPSITVCFGELEMLSKSGVSWCLDERADGYIRSEAIVAVVLQRKSQVRRNYATILNSCTSSDGYTKEGITFPRREIQVETMKQTVKQSGVNPLDVTYVEAHITGTAAGDPIESSAIMEAYRGTSNRPLMLGCLKSNIGHSEASAGLCALTKVLKIFQTQIIPPNINMIHTNPRIESLREGRLKPVIKPTPFNDEIISIDAFGFGGSNTHVILRGPANDAHKAQEPTDYPRLVLICNRTREGINQMINTIEQKTSKLTNGFYTMLTNLGYSPLETGMNHRSYILIGSNKKVTSNESAVIIKQKPLCLYFEDLSTVKLSFGGANTTILNNFVSTAKLYFSNVVAKSSKVINQQVDLVIQQLAYAFLIKSLSLVPDLIIGVGLGKIAAQYVAGQITWENGILAAADYSKQLGKKDNGPFILPSSTCSTVGDNCVQDLLKWIQNQPTNQCINNQNCKLSQNNAKREHGLSSLQAIVDWIVVQINANNLVTLRVNDYRANKQVETNCLLTAIGQLYLSGHNPRIEILYPFNYPVERDCPSIGHLLQWKHDLHFENMVYPEFFRDSFRTNHRIDLVDTNYDYLVDYIVDDCVTLPTAGYIWILWEHLVKMRCTDQHIRYHSFELWSTQIHKTTVIKDPVEFRIASNPVTHQFVIKLGEDVCVTGYAKIVDDTPFDYDLGYLESSSPSGNESLSLTSDDFYTEMSIRGLKIKPNFQAINQVNADGSMSKVKYTGNWIVFIENCLLVPQLGDLDRCLKTISSLDYFRCDPIIINDQFKTAKKQKDDSGLNLVYNSSLNTFGTRGLVFKTPIYNSIARSLDINNLHHKFQTWLPYFGTIPLDNLDDHFSGRVNYLNAVNGMLTALDNPQDWINVPTLGTNDVLLNLLWETYKHPRPSDHLREQFILNREKLNQDRLLYDLQTQLLHQHLAIFEENAKPSGTINIKSLGLAGYPFGEMCYRSFRRIRNRYSFESNPSESTTPIKSLDLLIYNHESMNLIPSLDDDQSIQQLTDHLVAMEPSSFVIVQCRDSVLPLEAKLSAYTKIEMVKSIKTYRSKINSLFTEQNFIPISEYSICDGQMYSLLFRKKITFNPEKSICYFTIKDRSYQWISDLQKEIANPNYERIWLLSNETDRSGIIGLINSLKEESFGIRIKCIFSPGCKVDLNSDNFTDLLAKDLVINVLSNSTWGSFRHFELPNEQIFTNHKQVYLDWDTTTSQGNESKLVWCKLPNLIKTDDSIINYYGPLDFTSKPNYRKSSKSDNVQGVGNEFAGKTKDGTKVMGLCANRGVSNIIQSDQVIFALPVPANWSLIDGSSCVLPYTIAYYSLIVRGSLKHKSTILLHNLSDGLIEAAVSILHSYGCNIIIYHDNLIHSNMITLNGISKNQLLSSKSDLHKQIVQHTGYQGLDYIFSMDSTDQIQSLTNFLGVNGKLIHLIADLKSQKKTFETSWLPENASLESIVWPEVIKYWSNRSDLTTSRHLDCVVDLLKKGLTNGQIVPIRRTLFKRNDISKAVNQLHHNHNLLGRVIIQLIDNENESNESNSLDLVPCEARTKFNGDKCYLIFGGLGGVGLQLAQWIVEHGGRKIILISRKGVTKNYQKFMIHKMVSWPDLINPVDVKTFELPGNAGYNDCLMLIEKIQSTVGLIGGIFNLAGTLASGLFENQTADNYNLVCSSKVELTEHLDVISRSYCSSLDYFVCFSSIGSTGILGESNYCYANSYMERICEARWSSGHPACAIQFGAIGDVGMATDNSLNVIAGSVPQPIFSCLQTLDKFLQLNYPVMYSAISAEKSDSTDGSKGGFIQHIEHILGLDNMDSLDETITLGDLGLDSLQSIEVKDLIDKTYGVTLQNIAIGKLSIGSLLRFAEEYAGSTGHEGYEEEVIINLTDKGSSPIFFFPPALFDFLSMKALADCLQRTVVGVDLTDSVRRIGNLHKIAEFYTNEILKKFPAESKYYFVGYSYGCLIAYEVAKVLQRIVGQSKLNCICFIDATPYGLKRLGQITTKAALLGLPGSEVFCIAMDNLGVHIDDGTRAKLLEAEDDDEKYMELVTELMASAGMNGPAEGLLHNPVANIDRGYYLTHMDDLGKFNGDALFVRVLSKTNHGKPSTVCEGLNKIITGTIKEVLYNASHFDVLKVYAKEIAQDIEEMMPPGL